MVGVKVQSREEITMPVHRCGLVFRIVDVIGRAPVILDQQGGAGTGPAGRIVFGRLSVGNFRRRQHKPEGTEPGLAEDIHGAAPLEEIDPSNDPDGTCSIAGKQSADLAW